MNQMHKKIYLTFLLLPPSFGFAGAMGNMCEISNISTPCLYKGWLLGGQALYIQPTNSNLGTPRVLSANNSTISLGVQPNWGWGYQFQASYLFHKGNDFSINWYHYRHTNSSEIKTPNTISYTYNNGTQASIDTDYSFNSINPQWDQVNFEFGQPTVYDQQRSIRFHGGAQYSRVANNGYLNIIQRATFGTNAQNLNQNIVSTTSFNGFGPRIGLDLRYFMPTNNIALYAKGAFAILAGNSKANYLGDSVINLNSSQNKVVPIVDGKLGFDYRYDFKRGSLNLNMGWLWEDYSHVLSYISTYTDQPTTFGSFEIQGLFFGLSWVSSAI